MKARSLAWLVALGVAAASGALAQGSVPNALQGFSQNKGQPVQIEAASLEVRDKTGVATFAGNVKVVQGDTIMRCNSLVVFYEASKAKGAMQAATPGPGGRQQISKLEARGKVVVTKQDQTATGDLGHFDMKTNVVTLTGNVVVSQGQNILTGERLVVDLATGVSRVEPKAQGGRVQMLIQQEPGSNAPGAAGRPKIMGPRSFPSN